MGVRDVGDAPCAFFTKLNIQPARCDAGRNLQHLDKKLRWLVTRDIPNCAAPLVRRDKDAVTLRNTAGTDDAVRRPSVRPFCFPHGAKERKDLLWRGTQSQPVCLRYSIWFGDVHKRVDVVMCISVLNPSDPARGTRGWQPHRGGRVRCTAWLGLSLCLGNISLKCHSNVLKYARGMNVENTAGSRNRYLQLHVKRCYLARVNIVQLGEG
jgi:hypothetical protein